MCFKASAGCACTAALFFRIPFFCLRELLALQVHLITSLERNFFGLREIFALQVHHPSVDDAKAIHELSKRDST